MFQLNKPLVVIGFTLFGFILGQVWDLPYRQFLKTFYLGQYGEHVFLCDNAMRQHFIAKSRTVNSPSNATANSLRSAELGLGSFLELCLIGGLLRICIGCLVPPPRLYRVSCLEVFTVAIACHPRERDDATHRFDGLNVISSGAIALRSQPLPPRGRAVSSTFFQPAASMCSLRVSKFHPLGAPVESALLAPRRP